MTEAENQAPVQQPEDNAPEYTNQRVNWINPLEAVDEMGRQVYGLGQRAGTQFRKEWGITQFNKLTEEMQKSPYLPEDITAKGRQGVYRAIKYKQQGVLTDLLGENLTTSNEMDQAILDSAEVGWKLANGEITQAVADRALEDIAQSLRPEDIAGSRFDIINNEATRRAKFAGVGMAAGGTGAAIAAWRALSPKPDAGGFAKLTNALFIQAPAALVVGAVGALAGGALTATIGAKAMDMFGKGSHWVLDQMGFDSWGAAANKFVGGKADYDHEIKTVLKNAMGLGAERARMDDPRLQAEAEMQRQRAQQKAQEQERKAQQDAANEKRKEEMKAEREARKENTPNTRTSTPAPTASVDDNEKVNFRKTDRPTKDAPKYTVEMLEKGCYLKDKTPQDQAVVKAQTMEFMLESYELPLAQAEALQAGLAKLYAENESLGKAPQSPISEFDFLRMPVSTIYKIGLQSPEIADVLKSNLNAVGKEKLNFYKAQQAVEGDTHFNELNKKVKIEAEPDVSSDKVKSETVETVVQELNATTTIIKTEEKTAPALAEVKATPNDVAEFGQTNAVRMIALAVAEADLANYHKIDMASRAEGGSPEHAEAARAKIQQNNAALTAAADKCNALKVNDEYIEICAEGYASSETNPFIKATKAALELLKDEFADGKQPSKETLAVLGAESLAGVSVDAIDKALEMIKQNDARAAAMGANGVEAQGEAKDQNLKLPAGRVVKREKIRA